ncbi:MAG: hypothetical protein ABJD11_06575 [Gemmatimonadota bacterium]
MNRAIAGCAFIAGLLMLAGACSDSTAPPVTVPPSQLNVIQLPTTHPALLADSVQFWAVKGHDSEGALQFADQEDFVRLRIKANSLNALPNGTPIATGDSVLITIKATGDSVLFALEPSGLTFNAAEPARLKISYGEVGDDFNHDGSVTQVDSTLRNQLAIYRQPSPGTAFTKITTSIDNDESLEEIEAKLTGFSRYAISY